MVLVFGDREFGKLWIEYFGWGNYGMEVLYGTEACFLYIQLKLWFRFRISICFVYFFPFAFILTCMYFQLTPCLFYFICAFRVKRLQFASLLCISSVKRKKPSRGLEAKLSRQLLFLSVFRLLGVFWFLDL